MWSLADCSPLRVAQLDKAALAEPALGCRAGPLPSLFVGLSASRIAKLHDRIQWFEALQFGPQIGGMDEEEVRYHALIAKQELQDPVVGELCSGGPGQVHICTCPGLVAAVCTG